MNFASIAIDNNWYVEGHLSPLARQGSNAEYKALLMDIAEKLGHVIDGEPDSRLRTLGSIKHANHPELWQHWFKWMATPKNRPKGVAIDPEGFPYPQHICGFRRLMPITCPPWQGPVTTDDVQWQRWGLAKLLCILMVPGWYKIGCWRYKIILRRSWLSGFHKTFFALFCTSIPWICL